MLWTRGMEWVWCVSLYCTHALCRCTRAHPTPNLAPITAQGEVIGGAIFNLTVVPAIALMVAPRYIGDGSRGTLTLKESVVLARDAVVYCMAMTIVWWCVINERVCVDLPAPLITFHAPPSDAPAAKLPAGASKKRMSCAYGIITPVEAALIMSIFAAYLAYVLIPWLWHRRRRRAAAQPQQNGDAAVHAEAASLAAATATQVAVDSFSSPAPPPEPAPPSEKTPLRPKAKRRVDWRSQMEEETELDSPDTLLLLGSASRLFEEYVEEAPPSYAWPSDGTYLQKALHVIMLPLKVAIVSTIPYPDYQRFGKRTWMVSLLLSAVWVAMLSWSIIQLSTRVGCGLGVPPSVIGSIVVAAGSSGDAMSVIAVAKRGGRFLMAIMGTLSSSMFDLTVGLGLAWLLGSAAYGGCPTPVSLKDATHALVFVPLTAILMVLSLFLLQCFEDNKIALALLLLVAYAAFVVLQLTGLSDDDWPVVWWDDLSAEREAYYAEQGCAAP